MAESKIGIREIDWGQKNWDRETGTKKLMTKRWKTEDVMRGP
jgi:hypothetical protein